jgi:hypothetical protein
MTVEDGWTPLSVVDPLPAVAIRRRRVLLPKFPLLPAVVGLP